MAQGIDVFQRFQGSINWSQVKQSGVTMAFVKLTNGNGVASVRGDVYVIGAHAVGVQVGGYAYVLGGSPAAQADIFAEELLRLNALDLAPALDFEDSSLPSDQMGRRTWIIDFFTELKKRITSLSTVLLYASASWLNAINAETLQNAVPGLRILIWDAEYGPNNGAEHPVVTYHGTAAVHQYTSIGHVPGINSDVDRDDVLTDITENDMGNLQDTNPDWLQLVARVEAMSLGQPEVQWPFAPNKNEVNQLGKLVPQMATQLAQLSSTVAGLTSALQAVSSLLSTQHGLSSTDVYNAVNQALQQNLVKVDVSVAGQTSTSTSTTTVPTTPSA